MSMGKTIKAIFANFTGKNLLQMYTLEQVVERIESRIEKTQQAQDNFARAMNQYAEHLKSHTNAIDGLSKASRELAMNAAQQNKALTRLIEFVEQPSKGVSWIIPEPEKEAMAENILFPPGCYKSRRLHNKKEEMLL